MSQKERSMFWDNVAGVYDIFVNLINRKTHQRLREAVAGMVGPEDAVLECACGTGMITSAMAARCRWVTATDFSSRMLERAKRNCFALGNITYRTADITDLPFENASFDKVVAGNVIHLLDDPLKAVREMERVCRPGGTLIIPTYINKDNEGRTGAFVSTVGKVGADFKRQFNAYSYRQFFMDAGYPQTEIWVADGMIPCAVTVIRKEQSESVKY